MLFLAEFSVIKPDIGLIFWTTIIFLTLWFLIGRNAFKPIAKALKDREDSIEDALRTADKTRTEMEQLQAKNEELLAEAREERTKILREAKAIKENIIAEAKDQAREQAKEIVSSAKEEIENQKMAAMIDVKNKAGIMALDIAEKVIKKELKGNADQEAFVASLVNDIQLN